jgi:hypothetical protein
MDNQNLLDIANKLTGIKVQPIIEVDLDDAKILDYEQTLGVKFPLSYRFLLKRFGTVIHRDFTIYGLGIHEYRLPNVAWALRISRAIDPDFPNDLIPIHSINNGSFACLKSSSDVESQVVQWQSILPSCEQEWPVIADTFTEYLLHLIQKTQWQEKSLQNLHKHVTNYQKEHSYNHATGGKLPANHEWRPYRYCIQDVLFGSVVTRHDRKNNCLEVDVFLTANIPEYDRLAGAQALATFLLSEAYKCGGTMEIRFTPDVEGGKVPEQLQELASRYDLSFQGTNSGRISAKEAKALYSALTGFSAVFQQRLNEMEAEGRVKMVRACYVVHHGVWTREQVEMILLGSEQPDRILSGGALPDQWQLYQHDLLHSRAAVMIDILDRYFKQRRLPETGDLGLDLEDNFRLVNFGFDKTSYAREILCDEDLPIPWLVDETDEHVIPAGLKLNILIRPRDSIDLKCHIAEDLKQAIDLQKQTELPTFLLVPYDFAELSQSERQNWVKKIRKAHIGLLICPETTINLDAVAAQKLSQSRILRQ